MQYKPKRDPRITHWLLPLEVSSTVYGTMSNASWLICEQLRLEHSGIKTEIKKNAEGEVSLWRIN